MEDGRERRRTAVEAQLCKLEAGVAESFPAVVIHPIGGMPVGLVAGFHGRGGPARAGDRSRAFRMLRDDVDRLLDTDYVDGARLVAIEFVNMLADVDRLVEAARVLAYLDTTGGFGVLARDALIADAVTRIAADPRITDDDGRDLDARHALTCMRNVLDEPAEDSQTAR